MVHTVVVVSH